MLMPSELYNTISQALQGMPNVHVLGTRNNVRDFTLEMKISVESGNGTFQSEGEIRYDQGNEIVVGFDHRLDNEITGRSRVLTPSDLMRKTPRLFGGIRTLTPLETLDGVKKTLVRVPGMNSPIVHNDDFLVYEMVRRKDPREVFANAGYFV